MHINDLFTDCCFSHSKCVLTIMMNNNIGKKVSSETIYEIPRDSIVFLKLGIHHFQIKQRPPAE